MGFKIIYKEFVYKFLVDYLAKSRVYKIKNIKFIDLILNDIVLKGFSLFRNTRFSIILYIKNKKFNRVVGVIIIMFLLF